MKSNAAPQSQSKKERNARMRGEYKARKTKHYTIAINEIAKKYGVSYHTAESIIFCRGYYRKEKWVIMPEPETTKEPYKLKGVIPMKVGTVVKLKRECLQNPKGTIGVCVSRYEGGGMFIFFNSGYDGFSEDEQEKYLEEVGFDDKIAEYEFTNVLQLSSDFIAGKFNTAWDGRNNA